MNQQGLSLIEVMLVVVMVGLMILILANLPSALKLVGVSRHEAVAREVATEKMENLRSQGFTNLGNGTSSLTDSRLSQLPAGRGQVVIADCPVAICLNGESTKQVNVNISWAESNKEGTVELTTLISKGGLQ